MTPEEERHALEEAAVAVVALAIYISEQESVRDALAELSPLAQMLFHGAIVASFPFRRTTPPAWVRDASNRLDDRRLADFIEEAKRQMAKADAKMRGEPS